LTIESLYPNHIIERLLEIEKNKPMNEIHPDILKWREEPRPEATDVEYGGGVETTASSSSPPQLTEEQARYHRRRLARRQLIHNVLGVLVCLLLLKFVPTS